MSALPLGVRAQIRAPGIGQRDDVQSVSARGCSVDDFRYGRISQYKHQKLLLIWLDVRFLRYKLCKNDWLYSIEKRKILFVILTKIGIRKTYEINEKRLDNRGVFFVNFVCFSDTDFCQNHR